MQDCSIYIANALKILKSCTKPSTWASLYTQLHMTRQLSNHDLYKALCDRRSTNGMTEKSHFYWIWITGLIPGLRPANERHRYKVTLFLIGWAQTWNLPWNYDGNIIHKTGPCIGKMLAWLPLWPCPGSLWHVLCSGLILGLHPANERRCYKVTPSLIGWVQT